MPKKLTEKAKKQLLTLASAKVNNDPDYEKYKKVRDAAIYLRSKLINKYSK